MSAGSVCISERGIEGTRLRDVAAKAGVSIGLLQHYFESRDGLVRELFLWNCTELIRRWEARSRSHPGAPWRRVLLLIDELTESPDLARHTATWLEFCAAAARDPDLRGPVAQVFAAWRRCLVDAAAEAQSLGQIEPCLPIEDVGDILNAVVDGFELAIAVNADLVSPERFRHLFVSAAKVLLRPVEAADDLPGPVSRLRVMHEEHEERDPNKEKKDE